ncbi:uncharacterized protein CC84DRAFT_875699 [Paraphaeosphaeria sporulosa]|uniref:Uncharacterized protein n=1 Tax=Paraphaeosphaeria sporulosa TaxID=1460663 RepID=A0A177CAS4_9PLEO|nr:uncharacterized protein CC84DRAFT_875699 [Paraphaeosphaeria sporulosa]OAG03942.1 hypothetical protein CC84DRAFT_875699 [Paraphaeosphaeria sporulosa]
MLLTPAPIGQLPRCVLRNKPQTNRRQRSGERIGALGPRFRALARQQRNDNPTEDLGPAAASRSSRARRHLARSRRARLRRIVSDSSKVSRFTYVHMHAAPTLDRIPVQHRVLLVNNYQTAPYQVSGTRFVTRVDLSLAQRLISRSSRRYFGTLKYVYAWSARCSASSTIH